MASPWKVAHKERTDDWCVPVVLHQLQQGEQRAVRHLQVDGLTGRRLQDLVGSGPADNDPGRHAPAGRESIARKGCDMIVLRLRGRNRPAPASPRRGASSQGRRRPNGRQPLAPTKPRIDKRSAQPLKGRSRQGSKSDVRGSAQSAGQSPRGRRGHAGAPWDYCFPVNTAEAANFPFSTWRTKMHRLASKRKNFDIEST